MQKLNLGCNASSSPNAQVRTRSRITLLEQLPSPTRSPCSSPERPLVAVTALGDPRGQGSGQAPVRSGAPRRCSARAGRHQRWSRRALLWTVLLSRGRRLGCSARRRGHRQAGTGCSRLPTAAAAAEQRRWLRLPAGRRQLKTGAHYGFIC